MKVHRPNVLNYNNVFATERSRIFTDSILRSNEPLQHVC